MSNLTSFNERLAVLVTRGFGSMWAAYALTMYGLLPLLLPAAQDRLLYWSNVIQLVALPLLMVGQTVLGRASERQAGETHDAVMEELSLLRQAHDELRQIVTAASKTPAEEVL
ncbi:hypothetical protein [Kitasatospora sp. NPDC085464]|uniref:hypothetical protein n=1 Tax=Kitasatospora sp. NPDC085464 TaxID=3364063 RepID=UPI0037C8A15D